MKIDYTPIERNKKYKGKFVAIEKKGCKVKVIAYGKDPEKIYKEAKKKGVDFTITRVLKKEDKGYIFYYV